MTKKRRKNVFPYKQKMFNFMSFMFLLICTLWYGSRTVYFYFNSKKVSDDNIILNTQILKDNLNSKTFKKIGKNYYFFNNPENNYLKYSNILWRIVKINEDNEILLITEEPITSLTYGEEYNESYPIQWMNNINNTKNTGILENNITNIKDYLVKTNTCINNITDIKNVKCNKTNKDYYFSLLDIKDYINTGYTNSFINNSYYNYLANKNEDEIWFIDSDGELNTNDGSEILGIKPTITLKANINYIKGTGTEDAPYIIETSNQYFASYIKLDEDIYRVYNINETILKLSLNDYLKVNNKKLEYIYSNNTYYHNDTKYNSLAYYLNNTYYNTLKYTDIIIPNKYTNYFYGSNNDYDFKDILINKIDTKIYMLSIADPILNNLNDYFIATGTKENSSLIYIKDKDGTLTNDNVTSKKYVVPCISINKNILKKGSGTLEDPYRTE